MFRLLGLLGGLSVTTDLGTGAPLEESMRRCLVAVRLGRAAGCGDDEVRDVLYTALLEHIGCTAYAPGIARVFGDDVAATRQQFRLEPESLPDLVRSFVPGVAKATGRPRAAVLVAALTAGRGLDGPAMASTCEVATLAAERLQLPAAVQDGLAHMPAMWNGRGYPAIAGSAIPLPARIMHVATVATLFALESGSDRALAAVRARTGGQLDPDLVDLLTADLVADLPEVDAYEAVLDAEPDPVRVVDGAALLDVARTFGDLVDLKSPWYHGHSAAVALLAEQAATELGLNDPPSLRLAGHLHDLGRVAVSSRIWDKRRPLGVSETSQAQLHPYHSEQVLVRVPALRGLARMAGAHHERLDGSGYHRGLTADRLGMPARVLAAADAYRDLVEDRPGRPGLQPAAAAQNLRTDVGAGRLDGDAIAAVLAAAGLQRGSRRTRPAGLTARQIEVLRLLASGRSNREIATALTISPRTAEHHVQDCYARIGVGTRAGATLFAMQHGLLESG
jgi:HD-GYP domain-containing protein (c-di-GMP phosphodiesterase class II)